jgi:hypothetical protein
MQMLDKKDDDGSTGVRQADLYGEQDDSEIPF